ncbi:cyanophycinase [Emticicia fluvialis]|uniref:cyanophycinase n=1 Tax=Emticicia fluvialis TaxID=2974474 RepID=UPI002165E8F8|nr:cyanophycinase [Emticicia fluvialis]
MIRLLFLFILGSVPALAQEKLLIVGGGKRTTDVMAKFIDRSGGETGEILVITWAGGEPEESYKAFAKDVEGLSKIKVEKAPFAPLTAASKAILLGQLKSAKGIFFTGGDQNRIMDVLQDEELFNAMHAYYKKGVIFGGTSAGTAIMTPIMITGEGDFKVIDGTKVEVKKGLGLLPDVIVDQHFIKRQRQNRLIGLIFKNPEQLGVGIDENTALYIENNSTAEVLGESQVMIFEALKKRNEMKFLILEKGEKYDLQKRKRIK